MLSREIHTSPCLFLRLLFHGVSTYLLQHLCCVAETLAECNSDHKITWSLDTAATYSCNIVLFWRPSSDLSYLSIAWHVWLLLHCWLCLEGERFHVLCVPSTLVVSGGVEEHRLNSCQHDSSAAATLWCPSHMLLHNYFMDCSVTVVTANGGITATS